MWITLNINYLMLSKHVGRRGFEPLKSKDSGFTVRPVWPLWNLPVQQRAREGSRTHDLLITNQLLYQLSYSGLIILKELPRFWEGKGRVKC